MQSVNTNREEYITIFAAMTSLAAPLTVRNYKTWSHMRLSLFCQQIVNKTINRSVQEAAVRIALMLLWRGRHLGENNHVSGGIFNSDFLCAVEGGAHRQYDVYAFER